MAARSFWDRLWSWLKAPKPAPPRLVLIIRHAEKTGKRDDTGLNPTGRERANSLLKLFPAAFPNPDFLFAARDSKKSNRPVETVTPLSKALGVPVQAQFANDQFASLAKELLTNRTYAGKAVLICWHRGKIPSLARALGATGKLPDWPERQFDRIWRIDFVSGSAILQDLPQQLRFGDSGASPQFPLPTST